MPPYFVHQTRMITGYPPRDLTLPRQTLSQLRDGPARDPKHDDGLTRSSIRSQVFYRAPNTAPTGGRIAKVLGYLTRRLRVRKPDNLCATTHASRPVVMLSQPFHSIPSNKTFPRIPMNSLSSPKIRLQRSRVLRTQKLTTSSPNFNQSLTLLPVVNVIESFCNLSAQYLRPRPETNSLRVNQLPLHGYFLLHFVPSRLLTYSAHGRNEDDRSSYTPCLDNSGQHPLGITQEAWSWQLHRPARQSKAVRSSMSTSKK